MELIGPIAIIAFIIFIFGLYADSSDNDLSEYKQDPMSSFTGITYHSVKKGP